jgi:hypothetical protein
MDCEKFEATLIDELYEELDELTSAAAKRHIAGCARCASLLSGLRATRRLAVLPLVEPSADLEDRIMAAAKDAQKVVPIGRRFSRAVSWAGNWAMRPQTAMAAVFILMVGSSVLLVRGRHAPASATMTITEQGAPAASAASNALEDEAKGALDPKTAAAAHGAGVLAPAAAPPPLASAAATATAADGLLANDDNERERARGGGLGGDTAKKQKEEGQALAANRSDPWGVYEKAPANAAAPAGVPRRSVAPGPASQAAQAPYADSYGSSGGSGGAVALDKKDQPRDMRQDVTTPFDSAMSSYRSGNYADATRGWDGLAAGDANAALWAARAVRDGNGGCAAAKDRFDQVAARTFGTSVGYDATLEGGQCYRAVGALETARAHFAKLITVPAYAARAQAEIDSLSQAQVATRQQRKSPPAAKPVQVQASPPASPPQQAPPQATSAPAKATEAK